MEEQGFNAPRESHISFLKPAICTERFCLFDFPFLLVRRCDWKASGCQSQSDPSSIGSSQSIGSIPTLSVSLSFVLFYGFTIHVPARALPSYLSRIFFYTFFLPAKESSSENFTNPSKQWILSLEAFKVFPTIGEHGKN